MKRFLAPLGLILGLALVVAAARFRSGPADRCPETQFASQSAGPAVSDSERSAPVAQVPNGGTAPTAQAEPGAQAEAQTVDEPAVKTGCGKAVPCPNRDCKDCPLNRYLK